MPTLLFKARKLPDLRKKRYRKKRNALKTSVAVNVQRVAGEPGREGDFGVGELVAALGAAVGRGAQVVVAARATAALEAAVPAADDGVDDHGEEQPGGPKGGEEKTGQVAVDVRAAKR